MTTNNPAQKEEDRTRERLTPKQKEAIKSANEEGDFYGHKRTLGALVEKGFAEWFAGYGYRYGRGLVHLTKKGEEARKRLMKMQELVEADKCFQYVAAQIAINDVAPRSVLFANTLRDWLDDEIRVRRITVACTPPNDCYKSPGKETP